MKDTSTVDCVFFIAYHYLILFFAVTKSYV